MALLRVQDVVYQVDVPEFSFHPDAGGCEGIRHLLEVFPAFGYCRIRDGLGEILRSAHGIVEALSCHATDHNPAGRLEYSLATVVCNDRTTPQPCRLLSDSGSADGGDVQDRFLLSGL